MKRPLKVVNSKGKKRRRTDGYENKVVNCDIPALTGHLARVIHRLHSVFKLSTKLSYVGELKETPSSTGRRA